MQEIDIAFQVLFFSIIIVVCNLDEIRFSKLKSLVYSVIFSFITFFLSISIYFGIGLIIQQFLVLDRIEHITFLTYNAKDLIFLIPVSIISPILMFICYRIIFDINYGRYFRNTILVTIIALIFLGLFIILFNDIYIPIMWQVIMALALQILLAKNKYLFIF